MSMFLSLVIPGVVAGAIYASIAAGLVLTYQSTGVFNFAQGAVAFFAAYLFYQLNTGQHWPVWLAGLVTVVLVAPLLGFVLDRVLFRRLARAPMEARIVGTIGLSVALPALAVWFVETLGDQVWSRNWPTTQDSQGVPFLAGLGPNPPHTWHPLKDVVIDSNQLTVLVTTLAVAAMLWYVVNRRRVGLEMRAMVDKSELATLRGVDVDWVSSVSWMLSFFLAGLAGVLIAPIFRLDTYTFTLIVFGSLAAVAIAGFRSIPIAFAAGLGLGVLQNLIVGYGNTVLPNFLNQLSGFRSSIPFFLTVIILFFTGRERGRKAGSVAVQSAPPDPRAGLPAWRRVWPWAVFVGLLLTYTTGIIGGWAASDFWAGLIAEGVIFGVIFLSFVVVTGIGGMVSLAQATFVMAGAFSVGWAVNHKWPASVPLLTQSNGHTNFFVGALLGMVVAGALGALIAVPVQRQGPLAVAISTLALALCADLVLFQLNVVTNGSQGWNVTAPVIGPFNLGLFKLGPWSLGDPRILTVAALVLFGLITLAIRNLQRGAVGRAMLAVRSSEVAAAAAGVRPARTRILVFAVSAAIAGLGGALFAVTQGTVVSGAVPAQLGLLWLAIMVTWGVRRPGGALIAGLTFAVTNNLVAVAAKWNFMPAWFATMTSSSNFLPILFGLGAISLAQNPDGLLALAGHRRLERRQRRERANHIEAVEHTLGDAIEEQEQHAVVWAPAAGPAAFEFDGVAAGYGEVSVLHGVTLALHPGEIVSVIGPNGAGKTTLCRVAGGTVPITAGETRFHGVDVADKTPHARARAGIMVIPEARGVFPGLTVEDNLALVLRNDAGRRSAYDRFPILGQRRNQPAGLLSGGEQQLLSLASALVSPPKVLVADEPTLGLAPLATAAVYQALLELRDRGTAVLLVEEKITEVLNHSDVVAFIDLGRITWIGPRDAVDRDQLLAAYLGVGGANAEP